MSLGDVVRAGAALAAVLACGVSQPLDTGLQGQVRRGPITPVCVPELGCDAPFAAGFSVLQGGKPVARFFSDSSGAFLVRLAPGDYLLAPFPSAPVMPGQTKQVTVQPLSLTSVVLQFDTGFR